MRKYPPEMLHTQKKQSVAVTVLTVIFSLLILFVLVDLWFGATHYVVRVAGPSMDNTLYGGVSDGRGGYVGGDLLYAQKYGTPEHGDVVIVNVTGYPNLGLGENTERIIKRLIAVEGEAVKCENGVVSVRYAGASDFTPLDEPYAKGTTENFATIELGEGEIFVLGDNRMNSSDSLDFHVMFGVHLKRTDIEGVVPDWAIKIKKFSTAWEGFRFSLGGTVG